MRLSPVRFPMTILVRDPRDQFRQFVLPATWAQDDAAVLVLDMVINISKARSGDWDYVEREIRALCETAHQAGARLKVIFENAYHDTAAKIRLCEICGAIGVDWVKTSTGYAPSGATMDDLRLMRKHSPPSVQVKAAGGIRDLDALLAVRELGVSRAGATRTASMLDAGRQRLGLPLIAYQPAATAGY